MADDVPVEGAPLGGLEAEGGGPGALPSPGEEKRPRQTARRGSDEAGAAPKKPAGGRAAPAKPALPPIQAARKEFGQRLGKLLQTFLDDTRFHDLFAKQIPEGMKADYYAPGPGMIPPECGMWLNKLQKNARTDCLYDTIEAFMTHASLLAANAQRYHLGRGLTVRPKWADPTIAEWGNILLGEIEAEVAKFRHELEPLAAAILALDFPRPPPALPDYAQGILSEEAAAKRRQLCAAENERLRQLGLAQHLDPDWAGPAADDDDDEDDEEEEEAEEEEAAADDDDDDDELPRGNKRRKSK